jgi:hypothetical protein
VVEDLLESGNFYLVIGNPFLLCNLLRRARCILCQLGQERSRLCCSVKETFLVCLRHKAVSYFNKRSLGLAMTPQHCDRDTNLDDSFSNGLISANVPVLFGTMHPSHCSFNGRMGVTVEGIRDMIMAC